MTRSGDGTCKVCGKPCPKLSGSKGYRKTCSPECYKKNLSLNAKTHGWNGRSGK